MRGRPVIPTTTTEPTSWQLIEAVCELLRGIRTSAGFYTDLGAGQVINGEEQTSLDDNAPSVTVHMPGMNIGSSSTAAVTSTADVQVEAELPRDDSVSASLLAHRVTADIRRALHLRDNTRLPIGINSLAVSQCALLPVEDQQGLTSILVQVTATAALTEPAVSTQTGASP